MIAGFNHKFVLLRRFDWCPLTEENLFKVLPGRRSGLSDQMLIIYRAALEGLMVTSLEKCEVNSLLLPPEGYALISFHKIRWSRARQFGVRGSEFEFCGKAPLSGP